jgi:ribosome-associated toxin RatA of RatAB toxin-antitoxin module
MLMEVMSFRPNKVVRLRSIDQGQFNSEVVWRLEPLGENKSRVALELNILPANGFLGALIAPFVPQIESRVVKFVEQTLRRLKKVSEKEMVVSAA